MCKSTFYNHKVQYYETDKMGITHHSNYVRFMEEARIDFFEKIGCDYDKIEEDGFISPVINVSCEYKKTTTYPDVIIIEVFVIKCGRIKFKLGYTMKVNDTIVCIGKSEHCLLDENGRPVCIEKKYPEFYEILNG